MIEVPKLNLENYHCPNCGTPLNSSYCRSCGNTITSYLIRKEIPWPRGRDLAIDLTLVELYDRLAAENHLETLSSVSNDSLTMQARRPGRNFRDLLVVRSFNSSSIYAGESALVHTIHYPSSERGWNNRLYIGFAKQVSSRQARVYRVRYSFDRGLDHNPEILPGEIALAHSTRLTNAIRSTFHQLR